MNLILQTDRLLLREFLISDAESLYMLNDDYDVIKYTGDVPFLNVNEAKLFLKNYNPYKTFGFGRWAVIDKSNNEFLGWCGLKFSPELQETDIGFRFFKKNWNKGYATEAANACIHFGFDNLNLKKIVGRAMESNTASIKVLEKIGMQYVDVIDFKKHRGVLYQIQKP